MPKRNEIFECLNSLTKCAKHGIYCTLLLGSAGIGVNEMTMEFPRKGYLATYIYFFK